MHLTETELQTLADGELGGRRGEVAGEHLARCPECANVLARFGADDRRVADWLRAVDHPLPRVSLEQLTARAVEPRWPRWQAMAAGIAAVAVAAAGAAAVMPNSPVRSFFAQFSRGRGAAVIPQVPQPNTSSVGFAPANVVNVVFTSSQPTGEIGVVLSDAPMVRVAHRGEGPSYTLTADGLLISNQGSRASYDVTFPRAAPAVHIRVGREVVFARDGGHITAVTSPDREGRYLIRFAGLSGPTK